MTSSRQSARSAPTAAELLDHESNVAKLTAHAERLLQLQRHLEQALPGQLARTCRVANWRLGKLVILATNGAVAAKLRQVLPGLSEKLRQNGLEVNEIDVKVQPSRKVAAKTKIESHREIGSTAKQALTDLSQKLPADDALRQVLERLIAKK